MIDAFALLVMFGTGFAAGMYITTQLEDWIEKKITKKEDQ